MSPQLMKKITRFTAATAVTSVLCITGLAIPAQAAVTPNPIDTNSREAVANAYKTRYMPALSTGIDWTGNASTCSPGTQSAASKTQEANVINFYRGLNGLDSIVLDNALNTRAQTTALLMHANQSLNHHPPTTWKCYTTTGAAGAGKSNLFGGPGAYKIPHAATPIDSYMAEPGSNNTPVGHRRWILNPSTTTMGVGTTSSYNAVEVVGTPSATNRATPAFMPYPNAGYSPMQLEPDGRWSLSSSQGVDFTAATVTVKKGAETLAVTKYPVQNNYGPNTIVFQVSGITKPSGGAETAYTVTVNNMKKDGKALSHTYTVKLFDPTLGGTSLPDNPSIKTGADIVAYDANAILWNYGTLNPSTGRKQIGSTNTANMPKNIFVTDWNADDIVDTLVQSKDGTIIFNRGLAKGGFTPVSLGQGWSNYDITVGKWKATDKYPSIIARNNATGELFNYINKGGTNVLSERVKVGAGWNGLVFNLMDWDKDGKIDVVAKNSAGEMKLYRTNGAGTFLSEPRKVIGGGWNSMTSIKVLNGHNGAGTVGILARDTAGKLWYYQSNKSSWAARKQLGQGWNGYLIAGN